MKFSRHIFFMLGIATMTSFGQVGNTIAATFCDERTFSAGTYCVSGGHTKTCPSGCYCVGSNKQKGVASEDGIENYCKGEYEGTPNHAADQGIYRCPSDWPKSDAGTTSEFGCYVTYGSRKLHNMVITSCNVSNPAAGQNKNYLAAQQESCSPCPAGYICKGGRYHTSQTTDQGAEACPQGKVPNDNQTYCVDGKTPCLPGAYLPAGSEECAACPSGYVCLGSSALGAADGWAKAQGVDQGKLLPKDACTAEYGFADDVSFVANGLRDSCDKCAPGTKANPEHTECVETFITIPAGYYLPANGVSERPCNNPKKFCPGGDFWKSYVDQGIYDCPGNGSSSGSGYASCVLTLGEEELQYGLSGEAGSVSKCWLRTDPDDFRYCVFGIRGIVTENSQYIPRIILQPATFIPITLPDNH